MISTRKGNNMSLVLLLLVASLSQIHAASTSRSKKASASDHETSTTHAVTEASSVATTKHKATATPGIASHRSAAAAASPGGASASTGDSASAGRDDDGNSEDQGVYGGGSHGDFGQGIHGLGGQYTYGYGVGQGQGGYGFGGGRSAYGYRGGQVAYGLGGTHQGGYRFGTPVGFDLGENLRYGGYGARESPYDDFGGIALRAFPAKRKGNSASSVGKSGVRSSGKKAARNASISDETSATSSSITATSEQYSTGTAGSAAHDFISDDTSTTDTFGVMPEALTSGRRFGGHSSPYNMYYDPTLVQQFDSTDVESLPGVTFPGMTLPELGLTPRTSVSRAGTPVMGISGMLPYVQMPYMQQENYPEYATGFGYMPDKRFFENIAQEFNPFQYRYWPNISNLGRTFFRNNPFYQIG